MLWFWFILAGVVYAVACLAIFDFGRGYTHPAADRIEHERLRTETGGE
jgi:hypothetical protein